MDAEIAGRSSFFQAFSSFFWSWQGTSDPENVPGSGRRTGSAQAICAARYARRLLPPSSSRLSRAEIVSAGLDSLIRESPGSAGCAPLATNAACAGRLRRTPQLARHMQTPPDKRDAQVVTHFSSLFVLFCRKCRRLRRLPKARHRLVSCSPLGAANWPGCNDFKRRTTA